LKNFPFPDILQVIAKEKKNGILLVEWKDLIVAYYIKNGHIIFARPVDKITRIYTERNFPEILKKLRVKPENIPKILEKYLLQRLGAREGIFSLIFGFVRYKSDEPITIPIEQVILEASRQLTPMEVRRKISDEMLTFTFTEDAKEKLKNLKLTPVEQKVVELIDGKRTVADIRKALFPTPEIDVDRALYGLWSAGIIKRVRRGKRHKPEGLSLDLLKRIIEKVKDL
jgi:DNA-directed RNA polymerase subunit H (RpoH/RPB5)